MTQDSNQHRAILERLAEEAMVAHGLLPDFSDAVRLELKQIQSASSDPQEGARDLRDLLWCSIDNDDSLDLDQITCAIPMPDDQIRILVAIADVDILVHDGTAIDQHARHNTTSVYTAARIFPMLPEQLSNGSTSLNGREERLAMVADMVVGPDGDLFASDIYPARVYNRAKLAYNATAAWLEGRTPPPDEVSAVDGLAENLRLQEVAALRLQNYRHRRGALSLETIEASPVFAGDRVHHLEVEQKNRAKTIIEDLMIAANETTARFLLAKKFPSIRRVVRTPKRWDRIVEVAQEQGARLPDQPDAVALEKFLSAARAADPMRFPDLSLTIIKLLGAGEYVAEPPGDRGPGHFGLAVKDYTHSTAPNRRYTDLLTQRLLKAALAGQPSPYSLDELETLARHCTLNEDEANKIERQVGKSAVALLLQSRIGEQFAAITTGASAKGTWVRLLSIPVEGKLVEGYAGVDVGHRVHVQLISVDVEKGYIDFKLVGRSK
jgi:VacB/RNase II family 3'-5' exoribonuclease